MIRILAALCLAAMLSACQAAPVGSTGNTAYSPREIMETVKDSFGLVQSAALGAINSGTLPAGIPGKIAAGTQAATDAIHKADAEAGKCLRDQATGIVGDAPGLPGDQHCNPAASALLIGAAQSAIGNATGLMAAFNIKVN